MIESRKKKILLFGANGQVGWQLRRSLAPVGELIVCSRDDVDIENFDLLRKAIKQYKPNIIVNATAYTNVDMAETEQDKAEKINATAVRIMAEEAKNLSALLVHYSTDYVFDGNSSKAYLESDQTSPISVYGKTKLLGEEHIINSGCAYLIFRTSWVYSSRRKNFIKTIVSLAKEKEQLKVVSDQLGSPTSADYIADVTALCLSRGINKNEYGIYNLTTDGLISWFDLAKFLIELLRNNGVEIKVPSSNIIPVKTDDSNFVVKRPKFSKLDSKKLKTVFGINIPSWQHHVKYLLEDVKNNNFL